MGDGNRTDQGVEISYASDASARVSGVYQTVPQLLGLRCLLVEDEPLLAVQEKRLLERYGAVVTVAATVAEAMRALSSEQWDLAIVDLLLPDGSGEEVAERAGRLFPDAAIVVTSGTPDRLRLLEAQALATVVEKAGPASLLVGVGVALRRTEMARSDRQVQATVGARIAAFAEACGFSPQQRHIFSLAAWGMPNKQIALELQVGGETLRKYWKRMCAKAGVAGEPREAVIAAFARFYTGPFEHDPSTAAVVSRLRNESETNR